MRTRNPVITLILCATLVLAAVPAAVSGAADAAEACALERTRTTPVGLVGVQADNVSYATEDIPEACQGEAFTLTGSNPGDDYDVCWHDADGAELECHASPGDEAGTIPDGAVEARITYWAGAMGTYTLTAPATDDSDDGPQLGENPVTGESVLYLHSNGTGVGNADALTGASPMNTTPPLRDDPAVWQSTPFLSDDGGSGADAVWHWTPQDGFNFTDTVVRVSFWVVSPGATYDSGGWTIRLMSDGAVVAEKPGTVDPEVATPGVPAEFATTFTGLTLKGRSLSLQIDPYYVDSDDANLILYDSPDYPSRVHVGYTPPVTLLDAPTVADVGATHVQLAWNDSEDVQLDHYRVIRDGAVVAEPEATSLVDTGLSPATTHTYEVHAVSLDGNVTERYAPVNVTTHAGDAAAPAVNNLTVEAGATAITVRWVTSETTTGAVDVGKTTAYGDTHTSAPGLTHEVTIGNLEPGAEYHLRVTATDLAGNANVTDDVAVTMSDRLTLYLHNQGEAPRRFMNEFNETDNDLDGYNVLGGAFATVGSQVGVDVFGMTDVYPAEDPTNPGVTLDTTRNVEATIYLQFSPLGGTILFQDVGTVSLNLTLRANGGEYLGGQTVHHLMPHDQGWVPFEFSFPAQLSNVTRGSLVAEVVADAATTGYVTGYEGDHASWISIPVQEGLPMQGDLVQTGPVMAGAATTFEAKALGGEAPLTYEWTFSDGGSATGATVTHAFAEPGHHAATVTVTDASGANITLTREVRALQRDFTNNTRTVVAVVDTGVNPYHPQYARPGIDLPLSEFTNALDNHTAPRVIDLSDVGDYETRVNSYRRDRHAWAGIETGELVYFEGTNVLGVSMEDTPRNVLDTHSHGTATSSTVLNEFPDAIIVMVQVSGSLGFNTSDMLGDITEGVEWAASQPWIDVISVSMGMHGNAPLPSRLPEVTKAATDAGKVVVVSAGNDPSPLPTDSTDGPPWVISVTGSQENGEGHEVMSSNIYPDYTSHYTVTAASHTTTEDEYISIGGTSFSCPAVAGTIAGVIHSVREATGHTGGIVDGELAPGVTNEDVRAALNKTAILPPWNGYVAGFHYNGDHTHPPQAPWLTAQWGHVDSRIIDDTADAILRGDLDIPQGKTEVALYKKWTHNARVLYWG